MTTTPEVQPQGGAPAPNSENLVEVKNLKMYFPVSSGTTGSGATDTPELAPAGEGHLSACFRAEELGDLIKELAAEEARRFEADPESEAAPEPVAPEPVAPEAVASEENQREDG